MMTRDAVRARGPREKIMLELDGIIGLALLALWIYCLIDVIGTPEAAVRNLPKLLWLLLVVVLAWVGCVLWLVAGRSRGERTAATGFYAGAQPKGFPEYERLGRSTSESEEADAEFLRQCRERAQQQRLRYQQRSDDGSDQSPS